MHDMIVDQSYLVGIGCEMRHSLLDCILHFISFLLLCVWNLQKTIVKYQNMQIYCFVSRSTHLLAQLDTTPLQNECVLLAVSQVNVDARRGLGNCKGTWWRSYLLGNSGTEKWEHIFKTMSNYNNHGFLEVLKGGSVSSNELLKVTMYEIQHLFASLWVFWQLCKRLGMI